MRAGLSGTKRARTLRRSMTDAERRLWERLRRNQMGVQFRRQHPVPPYFADFACVTAKLIVEADGGQHGASVRDKQRDAFLTKKGWRVLRFWNNEIAENLDGVVAVIAAALAAPSHSLPRQAGEG